MLASESSKVSAIRFRFQCNLRDRNKQIVFSARSIHRINAQSAIHSHPYHAIGHAKIEIHPMSLAPGTRLGPYEITAPIGAGGMSEVYRARDTRLGREVAVKVVGKEFS